MSEMNVTRRNFLSGAALVSAAIAGAGLAGCAPQSAAPAARFPFPDAPAYTAAVR